VKGVAVADHTVERLMRMMSEEDKEAAISYFHNRTTKPVTTNTKKKDGSGQPRSTARGF
jgi:hypothetical protein